MELFAHIVLVTKYRKKILTSEYLDLVLLCIKDSCEIFNTDLLEFEGESDHIHILIQYPSNIMLSKLIATLKSKSSFSLFEKFPVLLNNYRDRHFWTPSYFISSCGNTNIETIKRYIQQQERPD